VHGAFVIGKLETATGIILTRGLVRVLERGELREVADIAMSAPRSRCARVRSPVHDDDDRFALWRGYASVR
jgi:hypothetical protein